MLCSGDYANALVYFERGITSHPQVGINGVSHVHIYLRIDTRYK